MSQATATRTCRPASPEGARVQPKGWWLPELGLLAVLYAAYLAARALMGVHLGAAHDRGRQILALENHVHLGIEHPLNSLVTRAPVLGLCCAYAYATLHYVVTPAVLVWMATRRWLCYGRARNALVVMTVIGLVGYWLLPTAPPRLVSGGFTDTMAVWSHLGWWGEAASAPRGMEALSNQYAALPSLHVGWAVWVALCVWRYSGRALLRRWAWTYPALMAFVVMATANHYLLDVVGGVACAFAGDWLSRRLTWARPSRTYANGAQERWIDSSGGLASVWKTTQ